MPPPSAKRFSRGDRVYVQAQQIWLILMAFAMTKKPPSQPKTMTYGELALTMGYDDTRAGHTLGRQLGIVGQYCVQNDLPPLNVIVVNQETGMPGDEVVLRPGRFVKEEQKAVLTEDWFTVRVPTTGTFRQIWEGE